MSMDIRLIEQRFIFVFEVVGQTFRVSFERAQPTAQWAARLLAVERNEVVYSANLESSVLPDIELAQDMVRMYISRD